jgi:hypothetical protein
MPILSVIPDLTVESIVPVVSLQMFFFAAFAFAAALGFGLYAMRYTVVDHYRKMEYTMREVRDETNAD